MAARTMFEKIWNAHIVHEEPGQPSLIYVDLHLVHEVTSPQAFDGLRLAGRKVRRPDLTVATADHNTPTWELTRPIEDQISKAQLDALDRNAAEFGLPNYYDRFSENQGIVHVIGPDLGYTLPGKTVVCGDSHTSTHGALGCFAVDHGIRVDGPLPNGVSAKDVIFGIIGKIGVNGGTGHVIEYTGEAIRALSMDGRMTVCNMSIEAGARAGMIAPDDTTFDYVRTRPYAPKGAELEAKIEEWRGLVTDAGATYDKTVVIPASELTPFVTWGTKPDMVASVTDRIPDPASFATAGEREAAERALEYMGLEANQAIQDIKIDRVFLGACTNARIDDLRAAANVIKGRQVNSDVYAMVVPGSARVKMEAEAEGLDQVFKEAGFDWRVAGCSMCLGMNPDILEPGQRCASTSNRNFEGRQGNGGRTHLVSPEMAAAAAIAGHFVDVRDF
ncbi:3-isopropylmalate dehydratase large subunit [Geodia barretti]|uniref:3-isopropylmalate dehydratase n=1 Tax=Geodia barretti TaxID=519541 RepID=A0AA35TCT6_GEOBA|nr:3-isopropylmalate dehydratase large subunit [Geodia barretti]